MMLAMAAQLQGGSPPGPFDEAWESIAKWVAALPVPPWVVALGPLLLLVAWLFLEGYWLRGASIRRILFGSLERLSWLAAVFAALWFSLPTGFEAYPTYIAIGATASFPVLVLRRSIIAMLREPSLRTPLLIVYTVVFALSFAALWYVTLGLPSERASYFVLWHQIVRVAAALTGTTSLLCVMFLLMPLVMDRFEGRSFIQFVASRHVRAGKSRFLTAISFLSIAGVAVSSCVLCVVIAVMTGFGEDLKRKILDNNAHVKVEGKEIGGFDYWRDTLARVRATPGVQAATPIAAGEAMASSRSNTAGVQLRGIETDSISTVIALEQNIEVGSFDWLNQPQHLANLPPETVIWYGPGGQAYYKGSPTRRLPAGVDPTVIRATYQPDEYPGIVLGRELAKTLHVYVGEPITLIAPLGDLGPMGMMPRNRRFRVAGIFYSGMYEYDASNAYVMLEDAQEFLDLGPKITDIDARVANQDAVGSIRAQVERDVGREDLRVRDWQEMNRQLFSALKLEKLATFIILGIAIVVASFCIICTLLLMVTEKSKEIAILKALGASDRMILRVFMLEGVIIGAIGTIFGVATGVALTVGTKSFGVRLPQDIYYVDRLPVNIDPMDFLLVAICSMLITTLATIYPALAASRLRPVEGIRYE